MDPEDRGRAEAADNLRSRRRTWRERYVAPPPDLTVSEWADDYRFLSPESSSQPGKWHTELVEPGRAVMDAFSDPRIETVTCMVCTQLLKTETINNVVGYHIHQEPAPILVLQPNQTPMAESYSKDRLAPMVRDTPVLRDLVPSARSRDSENTILHKRFLGGHVTIAGANSPASLSSRPIRVLLCDEVDRYPPSTGTEGDPITIAERRTETFWNRKKGYFSSPTSRGLSRIEKLFELSDKRRYFVPCPHCGHFQHLKWGDVQWPDGQPDKAGYVCEDCGGLWDEGERLAALQKGEWRQTAAFRCCRAEHEPDQWNAEGYALCPICGKANDEVDHAGFHISQLASPWRSLASIAREFLDKKGDREQLKAFVTTVLAETFEEAGERIDEQTLLSRRDTYPAEVPSGVLVLTAGVDVQADRLEVEVVGWGDGEESWNVDYRVLYGDTTQGAVYQDLDNLLDHGYRHEDGVELNIAAMTIDAGYRRDYVIDYTRNRASRRVYAVIGREGAGRPVVAAPTTTKDKQGRKIKHWVVGVDSAKDILYSRLQKMEAGPGYCHFPAARGEEYFEQLTAEKKVTRYRRGWPVEQWEKIRPRNEALDCRLYAHAAIRILNPPWDALAQRHDELVRAVINNEAPPPAKKRRRRVRSKGVQ